LGNRSGGGMPEKNHGPESLSSFFPHFAQAALRSTRHLESSVGGTRETRKQGCAHRVI